MDASDKTIGIFGGTFDPVHNGHVAIVHSFLNSGVIDELWIFLTPFPPHKQKNGVVSYSQRLQMLEKAFESLTNTVVSDLESNLPKPSFTVQTISSLKNRHPGYAFYLCMGKDSLASFTQWHRWRDIIAACPLLVADRPGSTIGNIPSEVAAAAHFVDHEPVAISSTKIRKKLKKNESVGHLLPAGVLKIIEEQNLYTGS